LLEKQTNKKFLPVISALKVIAGVCTSGKTEALDA